MYLLLDHIWPMPGKKCVDHVDFFGTFGDVKVLSGVEDRLAGALAEKVRIRGSTEKDLEAHSYPIEP
jgi:hypothetical protein